MIFDGLNHPQQEAVRSDTQYRLVLAGAGSGKTRVLTSRMAFLVQQGVSAYALMAVTFTNKAAKEMLNRLADVLPLSTRHLWVGTFHSLCHRFLRLHYREAGLSQDFQILDMSDQLSVIKRVANTIFMPDALQNKQVFRYFQNRINQYKEQGLRSRDIDFVKDTHPAAKYFLDVYALYEKQCGKEGLVDFTELLLRSCEVLEQNAILRQHYQERFYEILIDEFQDTNDLQYRWLRLMAGQQARIFAVGDDDQSIYAFRGANVGNMWAFEQEFAKGQVTRLEQNYRSTGHILDAANAVIQHNAQRLGKNLWTDRGAGQTIALSSWHNEQHEAVAVADEIRSLDRAGVPLNEIAILYRNNAMSRVIEHALVASGIAYRVYGGLRFYDRQEIKDVLAYLHLIQSHDRDTAFLRVVNQPSRGIGLRTLEQLQEHAREQSCSLWAAVDFMKAGASRSKLEQFQALVEKLRLQAQEMDLPSFIRQVIELTGLEAFYAQEASFEKSDRLDNLDQMVQAAQQFVEENAFSESQKATSLVRMNDSEEASSLLSLFLGHCSLESSEGQASADTPAVQLMTVHASKGLEFDTVFLVGVEEGIFPHSQSIDEGLEDEERRLFYVAITRAMRRLYLSMSAYRALYGARSGVYSSPSRFISEIPEAHVRWLTDQPRSGLGASRFSDVASNQYSHHHYRRDTDQGSVSHVSDDRQGTQSVRVNDLQYTLGMQVIHPKFGEGEITRLISGDMPQAEIRFVGRGGREAVRGTKTIALAYAKLSVK